MDLLDLRRSTQVANRADGRIVSQLSSLDEKTLEHVAAGSFIYSALLLIEGIGLCRKSAGLSS